MSAGTFCFVADNTSKKELIFLPGLAFYLKLSYLSEFVIQLLSLQSGPQFCPRNPNTFLMFTVIFCNVLGIVEKGFFLCVFLKIPFSNLWLALPIKSLC